MIGNEDVEEHNRCGATSKRQKCDYHRFILRHVAKIMCWRRSLHSMHMWFLHMIATHALVAMESVLLFSLHSHFSLITYSKKDCMSHATKITWNIKQEEILHKNITYNNDYIKYHIQYKRSHITWKITEYHKPQERLHKILY